ncbi:uncharacterized protein LOC111240667 [Vigna radiata var. radiata]|uniref:Uncharacterized protein LOC111240667 n=1 Tax=Vigna radiata var. radiata TaxID=3916 RepID=A0A3Q0ENS1_VIGRR|nr:uncharacterized protein LOC111240667 [Vigna radiata var. radiata]
MAIESFEPAVGFIKFRLAVSVGYRGRQIGFVFAPGTGGCIKARTSSYATLTVDRFEVFYDAFYFIEDVAKGVIPFDTESRDEKKLGLFFFTVPLKKKLNILYLSGGWLLSKVLYWSFNFVEVVGSLAISVKYSYNNVISFAGNGIRSLV